MIRPTTCRRGLSSIIVSMVALTALLGPARPVGALDGHTVEARANAAIQTSKWEEAAQLYALVVEEQPENASAWYRLGLSTTRSGGDTRVARHAYEKAIELGSPRAPALVGVARSWATEGNAEEALETLNALADLGASPRIRSRLESDETFAALLETAGFQSVLRRLTPCGTEEYRQFDFWVGVWRVEDEGGEPVGTNTVTLSLDGCLLTENWESLDGHKGMSINYFDNTDQKWTQIFRDNRGDAGAWPEIKGGLEEGVMVLESDPDVEPRSRWIWTPMADGRVRQMAETSNDGGKMWTVVWDSYYVPTTD